MLFFWTFYPSKSPEKNYGFNKNIKHKIIVFNINNEKNRKTKYILHI